MGGVDLVGVGDVGRDDDRVPAGGLARLLALPGLTALGAFGRSVRR
jgi:hypothetical protein